MVSTGKSDRIARRSRTIAWGGWLLAAALSTVGCASFSREDPVAKFDNIQRELTETRKYPVQQASLEQKTSPLPDLPDLSPKSVTQKVKEVAGYGTKPDEAKQLYAEAEQAYREAVELDEDERAGRLLKVADQFRSAAALWPSSALEEDALFMAGESYFFADSYPKANEEYERLLKKFPNSRYLDRAEAKRFSIAQFWLARNEQNPDQFYEFNLFDGTRPRRDTGGHALRVFDRIRFDDPTGKLADDATLALANAAFRKGDYVKADEFYTDLRRTFPSSEHAFDAHFIGLKAKLLAYRGPDYAGTLLDEAEVLVTQIRKQFPDRADQESEYLNRAYAEVRFRKAERLWSRVSYHRMRQEYGAARYYARQLLDEFSDTPFKAKADEMMASSQNKPATPPQRLSWLVNMFPESDPVKPLLKSDSATTKRR
ncbi:MAG: tetratricopeptide repeat protein [Planctomycetales bacterium]|nr:tetratricopeptide repeat protein [Planctomycetales bacterium]